MQVRGEDEEGGMEVAGDGEAGDAMTTIGRIGAGAQEAVRSAGRRGVQNGGPGHVSERIFRIRAWVPLEMV
jgi:hypothetical protein